MPLVIHVNSKRQEVARSQDFPFLLRDTLGVTATKYGCGMGRCGAGMVHLDGDGGLSGQVRLGSAGRRKVTTIEGLSSDRGHPVQRGWIGEQVPQYRYPQSGKIRQAASLLARTPHPAPDQIDKAVMEISAIVQHIRGFAVLPSEPRRSPHNASRQ